MVRLIVVRAFSPYRVGEFVPAEVAETVLASEHAGHVVAILLPQIGES